MKFLIYFIPVIDINEQQQIAQLIHNLLHSKNKANSFRTAKQAVEMAIEEGEGKAFEFLNNYKNKTSVVTSLKYINFKILLNILVLHYVQKPAE